MANFKPTRRVPEATTRAIIARLYDEVGGAKQVGFLLELGQSQVYKLAEDGTLSLNDAARLTVAGGSTVAAEYLATLAGGMFVPVAPSDKSVPTLLSRSAEEHGEVMSAVIRAMSDGEICAADARYICAEIDDALRLLVQARLKLSAKILNSEAPEA